MTGCTGSGPSRAGPARETRGGLNPGGPPADGGYMATTKKKRKRTTRGKKATKRNRRTVAQKRITAKIRSAKPIRAVVAERLSALEVKGDRLVVRVSKDTHPEIFDIDRLIKSVCKVINAYEKKRKLRDLVEFLSETQKSLEIILSNHLEDALRKYLK